MRRYYAILLIIAILNGLHSSAQSNNLFKSVVAIRILTEDSKKITPAMVCITNSKQQQPVLPPLGENIGKPSDNDVFFKGVEFDKNKNWVGPIRMTAGVGDNKDRSVLYGVQPSIPYWKAPVMYQTSGDFTIELPVGIWKISIQHGNEYIPIEQDFTIKAGETKLAKSFTLRRWIDLPSLGWYSGDVHVHHPTNKPGFRDYLLSYAKSEDLHLVNILEMGHHQTGVDAMGHEHSGTDFKQAGFGEKFRVNDGNYWLVSGQEDPRSRFGHIIGLNIDQIVRDTTVYDYYDLVFKNLKMQPGAVVGFAHFAWNVSWNVQNKTTGFPWFITSNQIDFVELLQFLKLNTLDYYEYLNLGFRITAAAGSDFPWASTIGEVRTMVYTGKKFTPDAWFEGLKAGNTFVTNGPALFLTADGKMPGSEIKKLKGSTLKLSLKGLSNPKIGTISRIAIYSNEGLVAELGNKEIRDSIELQVSHTIKRSQWIAAVVNCENGAVAHTSPVYVVVDGKPTYDLKRAPEIIARQIASIEELLREERSKKELDQGIIERLSTSISFYNMLLQQIKKEG
ncbi:CehA/McbA family metallohydrolase [Pedobacter jamesrossensis]|uniref:CehA/McbA family metallohydrolase n=1 Tax=Pedobacter jamesrossensis TaxID=1908238 RepID=A0ABV8NQM2_9SPHI